MSSSMANENSTTVCNNCSTAASLTQSNLLLLDFFAGVVSFVAVVGIVVNLTVLLLFRKFSEFTYSYSETSALRKSICFITHYLKIG